MRGSGEKKKKKNVGELGQNTKKGQGSAKKEKARKRERFSYRKK